MPGIALVCTRMTLRNSKPDIIVLNQAAVNVPLADNLWRYSNIGNEKKGVHGQSGVFLLGKQLLLIAHQPARVVSMVRVQKRLLQIALAHISVIGLFALQTPAFQAKKEQLERVVQMTTAVLHS